MHDGKWDDLNIISCEKILDYQLRPLRKTDRFSVVEDEIIRTWVYKEIDLRQHTNAEWRRVLYWLDHKHEFEYHEFARNTGRTCAMAQRFTGSRFTESHTQRLTSTSTRTGRARCPVPGLTVSACLSGEPLRARQNQPVWRERAGPRLRPAARPCWRVVSAKSRSLGPVNALRCSASLTGRPIRIIRAPTFSGWPPLRFR